MLALDSVEEEKAKKGLLDTERDAAFSNQKVMSRSYDHKAGL